VSENTFQDTIIELERARKRFQMSRKTIDKSAAALLKTTKMLDGQRPTYNGHRKISKAELERIRYLAQLRSREVKQVFNEFENALRLQAQRLRETGVRPYKKKRIVA